MPRAYSYIRFSTPEQSKGHSLQRQMEAAKQYADKHGLELDEDLTYLDAGVSAYAAQNIDAGMLGSFMNAVQKKQIEKGSYLLVENLDRLSRQVAPLAASLLTQICYAGITIVTLNDQKVISQKVLEEDPSAFLMAILVFMRAHEESATKALRGLDNWERKRKAALATGKAMTAQCPAWLEVEGGKLVINEQRAAVVREIFALHLSGLGQEAIARLLIGRKEAVWGKGKRAAKHWRRSYVAAILANPAVIGDFTPHSCTKVTGKKASVREPKDTIHGYYPAVVSEEDFYRVQELHAGARLKGRKGSSEVQFLFSRLAVCPYCGSFWTRMSKGSKSRPSLVCSTAKNRAGCTYRAIPQEVLESAFVDAIVRGVPGRKSEVRVLEEKITALKAQVEVVDGELSNLLEVVKSGERKNDEVLIETGQGWQYLLIHEMQAIEGRKRGLEEEIQLLRRKLQTAKPELVQALVTDLKETLATDRQNYKRLNDILLRLCSRVEIDYNRERMTVFYNHTDRITVVPLPGYKKIVELDESETPTLADEEYTLAVLGRYEGKNEGASGSAGVM